MHSRSHRARDQVRPRSNQGSPRRCRGDGGAALVEFGIVLPLLFLLIFGIIDFGWAFFQQLDVRHGAREGARLAAVNYKTTATPTAADQLTQIVNETCARMDAGDNVSVRFHRTGSAAVGQPVEVTTSKPIDTLTGFVDFALGGRTTTSNVRIRLEQDATWANMAASDLRACP